MWQVGNDVLEYILNEFGHCFGEIGCLSKPYHITLKPDVTPVVRPPRKVPISMRGKLKKELEHMVDLNIITPVTEPTDWVNSLVVVEKPNGSLRICLDPRDLNQAIKRQHYKLPKPEDILSQMAGAKLFTKLDASNAYWQIPLDEESSKLLTFNTPIGRYRFLRMPFGIHSASEICQQSIAEMLEGIEGSANSQDDIIIWAETPEQLRERTRLVLTSIRKHGLKLNLSKCQFERTEVTFLGHFISARGVEADPTKIRAINEMPLPTNKKELQRFLGMVNYLAKFIPNLSDHTAPLRSLLEKDTIWSMQDPQIEAIAKLKKLISTSPVLKFYDPNLPTQVSCDASKTGLGAVLEQKHDDAWYPVAYGSRSLSSSEQNYCQLERETLSIVFATHKFHKFYTVQSLMSTMTIFP